ncbi:hypothetical protein SK069_10970 [Patulibacter brassicae]|uniref:DUF4350 domain-containing protein n=1 Tax=Patulibacter brassicae TaxID=1705717 RepID=A0ABU4VL85_9ACTN|nr:hypothetical protein [Patulibacter brassicae]MDX8152117.1 hypothetical protein [Patulibacter brassicae]
MPLPRSVPRRRRPLRALLLASAAVLLPAPVLAPAATSPSDDEPALGQPGRSRTALFAAALRRDPIFVSPSLRRIATPRELAALRREVAAMPVPTFVVLAPNLLGEPDGEQLDRPALLHDRLARDGVYVTSTEFGSLSAASFGVRTRLDPRTAANDAGLVIDRRDGPFARIRQTLREIRTGVRPAAAIAQEERFRRESAEGRPDGGGGIPSWLVLLAAFAAGVAVPPIAMTLTPAARRRRAAARAAQGPRLAPVDAADARRSALTALSRLARSLAAATDPPAAAQRRYDAASKLLDDHPQDGLALVAAATLAAGGRALLGRPAGATWRPCFFDPRHGEATAAARFRRGSAEVPLPACRACAEAIAAHRAPEALADDGVAYWERDTAWTRSGFGAVDDDLADAVLRGAAP